MIITKLTLDNWCQHEHLEVEFSPKSNGILGRNGSGKTNLTKAIRVALTGRTDKGSNLEDEIRDGEVSTNIILEFLHNGTAGTIKRSLYVTGTNRASLTYGDIEVSGITETNKQIELLTGASNDMIEKFSFVGQDSLRAILFDTPGRRLDQLISMIPTIAYTKLYRGRVDAFLKTIPEIAMPYDEEYVTQKLKEYEDLGAELAIQYAKVIGDLSAIGNCKAHEETMNEHTLFMRAEEARRAQAADVAETTMLLNEATAKLNSLPLQAPITDFDPVMVTEQIKAFDNFDFDNFDNWKAAEEQAERQLPMAQQAAAEALEAENSMRNEHEAAVEHHTQLAAKANTLIESFTRWDGIKPENALCPICGTELQEGEMEAQKLKDLERVTRAKELSREADENARRLWQQVPPLSEVSKATQAIVTQFENTLLQAETFFETTIPPELTTEEYLVFKEQLEQYQASEKIRQERVAAQVEVTRLQARLELLSTVLGNPHKEATLEELQFAEAQIDLKTKAEAEEAMLLIKMTSAADEVVKFTEMLEQLEETKRERERVDLYRAHVNTVKDMLHRDQIPKMVLQYYLGSLREKVSAYLKAFEASFIVNIDDGFDMTFTKGGGGERQLERMSGGEKTVLSVSLHLAVSELFGNGLGVLVLDEPTSNMDVDYLSQFTQIIETLSSGILGGDRQLIVVTHQVSSMAGVFDKLIELGAQE